MWNLVFLFLFGGAWGEDTSCSVNPFELCPLDLQKVNSIPFLQEDVDLFCRHLRGYYKCFSQHKEEYPYEQLCEFPQLLSRAEQFLMKKFCAKSTFQMGFRLHADCLSLTSRHYDECKKDSELFYKSFLETQKYVEPPAPVKLNTTKSCLTTTSRLVCMGKHVVTGCGTEAFQVFKQAVEGTTFYAMYCPEAFYHDAIMRYQRVVTLHDEMRLKEH